MKEIFEALQQSVDAARAERRAARDEPVFLPDECEWFPLCTNEAVGSAAHPDHGVIPVCQTHVDVYRIPLIKKPVLESE